MSLFNFVKNHVSILDVIGGYTDLKRAGNYYKGRCPLHQEKTGSFTVSPDKHIYYCFGCHEHGDVISFIAKIEQCSQMQAAQRLIERFKLVVPDDLAGIQAVDHDKRQAYYKLCDAIARWCHQQLIEHTDARTYLKFRGVTESSIANYMIGYFPGGLTAIKKLMGYLQKQNLTMQDAILAHIVLQGKKVLYSPFEERIMFPITDMSGNVCGFGGRVFKKDDERAKYYNSHEHEFFSKGNLLFGLSVAKQAIKSLDSAVLVEGYTDCIALTQSGVHNTVATLGTACTAQHLHELSRFCRRVVVMYDGDQAGQTAILRLAQLSWQNYLDVSVVVLPKGLDPASMVSQGVDMQELIANAQDFFLFYLQSMSKSFIQQPLAQKAQLVRKVMHIIARLDDPLKRDLLLTQAAASFQMPYQTLERELTLIRVKTPSESFDVNPKGSEQESAYTLEKRLFSAILSNTKLIEHTSVNDIVKYIKQPFKAILFKFREKLNLMSETSIVDLIADLTPQEHTFIAQSMVLYPKSMGATEFENLTLELVKREWKQVAQHYKAQLTLAQQQGEHEKVQQLLVDFVQLKKRLLQNRGEANVQ